MAYESFSVSEVIPAPADRIYTAWLNSQEHTAFTGDAAQVEPFVGGKHSAFDGYAVGSTVELQPGRRIVQTWRATDFPPGSPDSRVEVTLEETVGGTMVTIFHTEIPTGQSDTYRDGWVKYYLEPLKQYFAGREASPGNGVSTGAPKAAGQPVVKLGAGPKATPKKTARKKAKAQKSAKPKSAKPRSAKKAKASKAKLRKVKAPKAKAKVKAKKASAKKAKARKSPRKARKVARKRRPGGRRKKKSQKK